MTLNHAACALPEKPRSTSSSACSEHQSCRPSLLKRNRNPCTQLACSTCCHLGVLLLRGAPCFLFPGFAPSFHGQEERVWDVVLPPFIRGKGLFAQSGCKHQPEHTGSRNILTTAWRRGEIVGLRRPQEYVVNSSLVLEALMPQSRCKRMGPNGKDMIQQLVALRSVHNSPR